VKLSDENLLTPTKPKLSRKKSIKVEIPGKVGGASPTSPKGSGSSKLAEPGKQRSGKRMRSPSGGLTPAQSSSTEKKRRRAEGSPLPRGMEIEAISGDGSPAAFRSRRGDSSRESPSSSPSGSGSRPGGDESPGKESSAEEEKRYEVLRPDTFVQYRMIVRKGEEVNIMQKIKPLIKDKKFRMVKIEDNSGKKPVEVEKKVEISNESDMLKISLLDSNDSGEIKYEIKEPSKKRPAGSQEAAFYGSLSGRSEASHLRSAKKLSDKESV
jgi:hypothetical protein